MTQFLPYHCPRLNGNFFKPPCARQIESAEERLAEYPNAMLGFLGKCLECGGKDLVKREGVNVTEYTGDIRPRDVTREPMIISQTTNEEAKINTGPATIRENRIVQEEKPKMEIANEVAPEPQTPFPPRCPKHPDEPQVACSPDSKRAGQYLGACNVCMADRKVGRKPNMSKEKMTPAVARDLGIVPAPLVPPVRQNTPAESEIDVQPAPVVTVPLSAFLDEIPICPRPDCEAPGSPVKIDRLGRNMGMCVACISARGRKAGINNHERGLTAPPVSIPLNQGKYAEIKAWLEAQAEENERTLQQEIMFLLKLSMRAGG